MKIPIQSGSVINIASQGENSRPRLSTTPLFETTRNPELWHQAQAFEASFIAQALKFSGLDKALTLSGGQGADAFTGFVLESLAKDIVEKGGFGIAENIYQQSEKKIDEAGTP